MCVCWSRRKPDRIQQVKERTEDKKLSERGKKELKKQREARRKLRKAAESPHQAREKERLLQCC